MPPISKAVNGEVGVAMMSHFWKRFFVLLDDQGAHFLRFSVVGVLVAGREHIGAEHDAPFDFRAKPFLAGEVIDFIQGCRSCRPFSIADAVKAGEIGGGFGRGQDVVDGNRIFGDVEIDIDDGAALIF